MPEKRYLQAAERHIATGQLCIARQRALIARLECHEGHEELLREAGTLLAQFLKIQTMHLADRDRLICELSRATTDWRIAQGQSRIVQQREMISRLESSEEESERAKDQLALLEGTQIALLAHRDRLDEMGVEGVEEMCRMQRCYRCFGPVWRDRPKSVLEGPPPKRCGLSKDRLDDIARPRVFVAEGSGRAPEKAHPDV